jgi:hypothetical protein
MKKFVLFLLLSLFFYSDICFSADIGVGFEMQDLEGSTINYSGTVGTSYVSLPASADKNISEILFKCPYQTPMTIRCQISFDTATYFDLMPGEFIGWSAKGFKKQVRVKGNQAGVLYQAIINYEAW